MSTALLNWREIDAVLAEWPSEEAWLRRIRQPDFRRIILEFSGREASWSAVVVLSPPVCQDPPHGSFKKTAESAPETAEIRGGAQVASRRRPS